MENKNKIIKTLTQLLELKSDFAILFGSMAKQGAYIAPQSDVDCGVFFHSNIVADRAYFEIAEHFEAIIGRKLDLICLNSADIIISAQIVATGELVFAHSQNQLDSYRAQIMSRYGDFKRSRKIIEDNILVRPNYGR